MCWNREAAHCGNTHAEVCHIVVRDGQWRHNRSGRLFGIEMEEEFVSEDLDRIEKSSNIFNI